MSDLPPPPGEQPPPPERNPKASRAEAKADAKASAARSKAMRPWYRKKRFILGGGLLLLIVIIVVVSSTSTDDSDTGSGNGETASDDGNGNDSGVSEGFGTADASGDVEVTRCDNAGTLGAVAELEITNNSSGRSDYFVTIAWETEDGSTRYTDAIGTAMKIEPDQSTTVEAEALEEAEPDAVCKVIEVQRTASN